VLSIVKLIAAGIVWVLLSENACRHVVGGGGLDISRVRVIRGRCFDWTAAMDGVNRD